MSRAMDDLGSDPRLKNIDNEIVGVVFEEFKRNVELVAIHLRDARNMWDGARNLNDDRVLGKAALLLASAALESNLVYLSGVALQIAQKKAHNLAPPQIRYLKGITETIDENGTTIETPARQSLGERLQIVPALLAHTLNRTYKLRTGSAAFKKLVKTIARRDAIVHPRWDRYVKEMGSWEAAEVIDAVELYLHSVMTAVHPYLVGYFSVLFTIPGYDHHEIAVGHRTFGKKGPKRELSTMEEAGIFEVLTQEWMDAHLLIDLALGHDCEGDSDGSMFTRAALVMLYAMLDAQLSVVSQWKMHDNISAFRETEILFLNEYAVGVGHDGEVWMMDDNQSFKKRIKAVPAILSRRVDANEQVVDLSKEWGNDLISGHRLRNRVMHSAFSEPLTRVSKPELIRSAKAVFSYFEELASKLPKSFEYVTVLLKRRPQM